MESKIELYKKYLKEEHPVVFGVSPEDIYQRDELSSTVTPSGSIELNISVSELLGSEYHLHMDFMDNDVIARCKVLYPIKSGSSINVVFDLNKIHLFDEDNKKAIF